MDPKTKQSGFTLVEIMVAMTLMGFALLGAQAVITDRLARNINKVGYRGSARVLVDDRLNAIQTDPQYSELRSRYTATEGSIPDFVGFTRVTTIDQRTGHLVVTVQVVTPSLADTVRGTAVIGAP